MNAAPSFAVPFGVSRGRMPPAELVVSDVMERDPRAMNRMDPETKVIHADLVVWGKETRDGFLNGWPSSTLLSRLMKQGPNGAGQTGGGPTTLSPRSEVIEACWNRLWGIGKTAIDLYYHTTDAPEAIARQMGISTTQLKSVLQRSRYLIRTWADSHPGFDRK